MSSPSSDSPSRWYQGITRYQWLVLIIASAGWIFDVYEGQIYNTTRDDMLNQLVVVESQGMTEAEVKEAKKPRVAFLRDLFLGVFLAGGMVGGLVFGILGDRWGRRPTMIVTILMYSIFSGLTYFATDLWQVGILRFLVSMGIGGEWAVAAAMVAEVFPARARAQAGGIFHASSTLGTWLAGITAMLVGSQWRYAYLVGVLPALLILWVRASIEEPEAFKRVEQQSDVKKGSLVELFGNVRWRGRAVAGMLLAAVGLATYWGVTVEGQPLAERFAIEAGMSEMEAKQEAKFAYSIIQATGGGLGLLAFGPLCQRLGRKRAFVLAHLMALIIVPVTCFVPRDYTQLLCILPFFGALTFGMHAGYAVYFPELFPAQLRSLGTSVCFNGGRILAAVMLPLSGYVKGLYPRQLPMVMTMLAMTYLLGLVVILFLPETKNQPLPE